MTTKASEASTDEVEILSADPDLVHLDGANVDVYLEELRTRQLFKFLRIITAGAGPLLADISITKDTDADELTQSLLAILFISIPEAASETIDFLQSMVKPVGLIENEKSKVDRQINVEKYTELYALLDNPMPVDTMTLITKIVERETPNMVALGKQIAALLPSAAKLTTSSKKPSKSSTQKG